MSSISGRAAGVDYVYGSGYDQGFDQGILAGTESLAQEIRHQFSGEPGTARNLGELLEYFRTITGDEELEWPH